MESATIPSPVPARPGADARSRGIGDTDQGTRSAPGEERSAGSEDVPRIGPNSLIQTRRALEELHGARTARVLYRWAGCPEAPEEMVAETHFVRLVVAVRGGLGAEDAARVLARSGHHTARYVHDNRIPRLVRRGVDLLPTGIGLRMLLGGIRRHAWTFVGGGTFEAIWGDPPEIRIHGCPTCRGFQLDRPGGDFYAAAFQSLLGRLLKCAVRVEERDCVARGDSTCSFTIDTGSRAGADSQPVSSDGENPCAS
jgi:divinyl protochlorophyllide a 8-vinyl-reductase